MKREEFEIESKNKGFDLDHLKFNKKFYIFYSILFIVLVPFSILVLMNITRFNLYYKKQKYEEAEIIFNKIKIYFKRLMISSILFFIFLFSAIIIYNNFGYLFVKDQNENILKSKSSFSIWKDEAHFLMGKEKIYFNKYGEYRAYNSDELRSDELLDFSLDSNATYSLKTSNLNRRFIIIITTDKGKKYILNEEFKISDFINN